MTDIEQLQAEVEFLKQQNRELMQERDRWRDKVREQEYAHSHPTTCPHGRPIGGCLACDQEDI